MHAAGNTLNSRGYTLYHKRPHKIHISIFAHLLDPHLITVGIASVNSYRHPQIEQMVGRVWIRFLRSYSKPVLRSTGPVSPQVARNTRDDDTKHQQHEKLIKIQLFFLKSCIKKRDIR